MHLQILVAKALPEDIITYPPLQQRQPRAKSPAHSQEPRRSQDSDRSFFGLGGREESRPESHRRSFLIHVSPAAHKRGMYFHLGSLLPTPNTSQQWSHG